MVMIFILLTMLGGMIAYMFWTTFISKSDGVELRPIDADPGLSEEEMTNSEYVNALNNLVV